MRANVASVATRSAAREPVINTLPEIATFVRKSQIGPLESALEWVSIKVGPRTSRTLWRARKGLSKGLPLVAYILSDAMATNALRA